MEVHFTMDRDLTRFELSASVQKRLDTLLDCQDAGEPLSDGEQQEAEGLAEMAEFLSLLRLRAERADEVASAS